MSRVSDKKGKVSVFSQPVLLRFFDLPYLVQFFVLSLFRIKFHFTRQLPAGFVRIVIRENWVSEKISGNVSDGCCFGTGQMVPKKKRDPQYLWDVPIGMLHTKIPIPPSTNQRKCYDFSIFAKFLLTPFLHTLWFT